MVLAQPATRPDPEIAMPRPSLAIAAALVAGLAPAAPAETLRIATFNAALSRPKPGALMAELVSGESAQAAAISEIVQRVNPDILLVNGFDVDTSGGAARAFRDGFLAVSQNGAPPIMGYAHIHVAASNTGLLTGLDLDGDGRVATAEDLGTRAHGNDSHGYGEFPGQYGFVIFSRLPIVEEAVRSFRTFRWADMPAALINTDADLHDFYGDEARAVLRLSSKSHVDLPVRLANGDLLHILAAHPTPPVFDGPEDRNGKRNHDEIRFWADYVDGANYPVDDRGGTGGLAPGARFVIAGDYNADPFDGDSYANAIRMLLEHPLVQGSATDPTLTPASDGGAAATVRQGGANTAQAGDPRFDTADFGFNRADPASDNPPGNVRVDYILSSRSGLRIVDAGVFWLTPDDPLWPLGEWPHSDHRLVWVDVEVVD
jgi:hypothetical protein